MPEHYDTTFKAQKISFPVFVLSFTAVSLLAPIPLFCAPPQRRPSVVLVVLDSVRADRTSPYGYSQSATPALAKLAEQAVVFENAYADSNWTGASFASMLTGKRPFSHGLLGYFDHLQEDAGPIQSILSQNGYETAASLTGLSPAPRYRLSLGFEHLLPVSDFRHMSRQVSAIIEWERKLPPEKDFFLLFHGDDVRWPYPCSSKTPENTTEFSEPDWDFILYYNSRFPEWDFNKLDPIKWKKALSYRGNAAFMSRLSNAYDLCVSQVDNAVASLLHELESETERPLLIIITADHGEFLGEHGLLGHGMAFFEPVVRVPLLIRFPGERNGRRVQTIAEHIDLLPTICKAAGIVCPDGLDGKDLAAAGEKDGKPVKWAAAGGGSMNSRATSAAFLDNGKKIAFRDRKWELFDLAADPEETRNIAEEHPEEFLKLASGYLAVSGAGNITQKVPVSGESGEDCSRPPMLRSAQAGDTPCTRARLEALRLAREHDFDGAAAEVTGSDCPPADILRDKESLKLLRQTIASRQIPPYQGYKFSTFTGLWKMQKDGFSVTYSGGKGLECETDKGLPSSDPGCMPPAAALLNCIEKYRFTDKEGKGSENRNLEEALRKAGYIQ